MEVFYTSADGEEDVARTSQFGGFAVLLCGCFSYNLSSSVEASWSQLSVLYLQGTSAPQACWTIAGIGIRLAQDVGAHRRKSYTGKLSVEGELWKRAFW